MTIGVRSMEIVLGSLIQANVHTKIRASTTRYAACV